jgi:hypothetical protein
VTLFSRFLETLRNTPDGDGSLLDHAMFVYGSGMANGNQHTHTPLPMAIVGGANGALAGDRHLKVPDDTPLGNALLGIAEKGGVEIDAIGESNGRVVL